jgi:nitrilase
MPKYYNKPKFKVAAVQAGSVYRDAPQWFDLEATLEKATRLIEEAGRREAKLVVFPECFLPAYPYFCFEHGEERAFGEMWAKLLWSSVEVPGTETEALCAAAKKAGTYVAIGLNERDKKYMGRMYNSILYLSPQGEILGVHRKICNTMQERLFHTPGDGGNNIRAVFKTDIGNIGGSICGEHCQLGLLNIWIMEGIQIHCSLWPGFKDIQAHIDVNTRALCFAGHCFGVLSSCYISEKNWPRNFSKNSVFTTIGALHGGSGIVNPHGEYIAGPVYDKETIVYAEVDLGLTDQSRFAVNLTGTYSRWDLINLNVREEPYEPLVPVKEDEKTTPEYSMVRNFEERIKRLEQQVAALSNEKEQNVDKKTKADDKKRTKPTRKNQSAKR